MKRITMRFIRNGNKLFFVGDFPDHIQDERYIADHYQDTDGAEYPLEYYGI